MKRPQIRLWQLLYLVTLLSLLLGTLRIIWFRYEERDAEIKRDHQVAQFKNDRWLINASKKYVSLMPGASYVHHADSFAMIRGGHLDLCVLGAFQVAMNGDFANWSKSATDMPSVGGAMDLAVGAKKVWLVMDHTTKEGESKLLRRCTYPLTAVGVATRVYTNLATLDVTGEAFAVREMAPGLSFEALQDVTDAPLTKA